MTALDPGTRSTSALPADPPLEPPVTGICPYLAAADGAWRSTTVAREHRCGAVAPPAILAAEKQRRLCLADDHVTCATYEAARLARPVGADRAATLPRPLARTTPVVLDHGRLSVTMPALRGDRLSGQGILIILLGLAFAAILLARLTGGGVPGLVVANASATPGVTGLVEGNTSPPGTSAGPAGSSEPSSGAGSSPDAGSAPPGSGQPSNVAPRTYKIKSGDTLIGIAAKFNTTPKAIAKLNGITNPAALKVGQVLKIP